MRVVAVVPAYNEETTVGAVINGLRQFVDAAVVVDDGSIDRTLEVAEAAGAIVLRHFLNRGQGAALVTGIQYALAQGADVIVTFDADGQHEAMDVLRLLEPLHLGRYDVVLGSRYLPGASVVGMPRSRRWLKNVAVTFDRFRTGLKITDTHNGLRAFSRQAAEKINIRQDGMAHASEILDEIARLELRYTEVPVSIHYTQYAKAKGQKGIHGFSVVRDLLFRRFL